MKVNNKAFTLVELLVAISILAILTILAIPTLRSFQANNSDTKYKNYSKSVSTGAKLYNDSYSDDIFGAAPYGCETVSLTELMNKKVAKDIALKNVTCNVSYKDSFAVVRKFNNEYAYNSYLYCVDDQNSVMYDDTDSTFDLCANATGIPELNASLEKNTANTSKKKSVVITISDEYGFVADQSFEYVWTTEKDLSKVDFSKAKVYNYNNKVIKTSGKKVQLNSKSLVYNSNVTGDIYLAIKPKRIQNIINNSYTTTRLFGPFSYDHTAPKCPTVDNGGIVVKNQDGAIVAPGHSAKELYYTFSFKDSDFANYDVYKSTNGKIADAKLDSEKVTALTYNPKIDGKYALKFIIRDYAGNEKECIIPTYIRDNVPPTCPTVAAKANGKTLKVNEWTTFDVNFTFGFSSDTVKWDWYTDNSANDLEYKNIKYKKWNTNPYSPSTKTQGISGQGHRSILTYVYDEAGNGSKCPSGEYLIEKCAATKASEGAWSKCSVNCGGGTQTRTVTTYSTLTGHTSYVCSSKNESQDCNKQACPAFKPAKPTITNGHDNKWTATPYTITMQTTSPADKLGGWYYSWDNKTWKAYSSTSDKNKYTTSKFDSDYNSKFYVRVCSKTATSATDTKNCSDSAYTTIKLDVTAPTITKIWGKKHDSDGWSPFYVQFYDISGLKPIDNKHKNKGKIYYCYDGSTGGCDNMCKNKPKRSSREYIKATKKWYDVAELDNFLSAKVKDQVEMHVSAKCGRGSNYKKKSSFTVYLYVYACDSLGNCAYYDENVSLK